SVYPLRRVFLTGEHEGVGAFDVEPEKRPRLVRLVVAGVAPDVTAPDGRDAGRPETVDHACGLGVVEQYEVASADQGGHLGRVGAQDPLVAGVLVLPEWT